MAIVSTFDHKYYYSDLAGLEFMTAYISAVGGATFGSSAAAGEFAQATAETGANMIAEAKAFWVTGVGDAGSTTAIKGFGIAAPKDYFQAYHSAAASSGAWSGTGSLGLPWAKALRSWYVVYGYDTTVAAIWAWLMAFTSNTSARYTDFDETDPDAVGDAAFSRDTWQTRKGTYDPTVCLARDLDTASATDAQTLDIPALPTFYEWACAGMLAAIQSSQNRAALEDAKVIMGQRRSREWPDDSAGRQTWDDMRFLGYSGLHFQTGWTSDLTRYWDVELAAPTGAVYRQQPESIPEIGVT